MEEKRKVMNENISLLKRELQELLINHFIGILGQT